MNLTAQLTEVLIERGLDLNRVVGQEQRKIAKLLADMMGEIEERFNGDLTEYQSRRLRRLKAEIAAVVNTRFGVYFEGLESELAELAKEEAGFAKNSINGLVNSTIAQAIAPANVLNQIVKGDILMGQTIESWRKKITDDAAFKINQAIGMGIAQGETNGQIKKRLKGSEVQYKTGAPLILIGRNLDATVRTAVQAVASEARQATYEANADVISALEHVSTLDTRTSDVCVARDGLSWDLKSKEPKGHKVPYRQTPIHWNCRSMLVPVTKSFRELGLDIDEFSPSTRSSMDGQVSGGTKFDAFLTKKGTAFQDEMLGVGRAQLWREGKITLSQLLDPKSGNPLTLAQLKAKYDVAPQSKPAAKATAKELAMAVYNNRTKSIAVASVRENTKSIEARLKEAAQDKRYAIESGTVYRGFKASQIGKSGLGTKTTNEAASAINAMMVELDQMATLFGVPKLRAVKTTSGRFTIASMGDGALSINPSYFNKFTNVLASNDESLARLKKELEDIEQQLAQTKEKAVSLREALAQASGAQYSALRQEYSKQLKAYDRMRNKYADKRLQLEAASKPKKFNPSVWKVGDVPGQRPHNAYSYFEDELDHARNTVYHEFAHHIHQMYGKTQSRLKAYPPIEIELKEIFRKVDKNKQASAYSTTNEKEWFAENFSLYMMDRADLVDPLAIELIERLIREQNI